jgi:hypothetical protein
MTRQTVRLTQGQDPSKADNERTIFRTYRPTKPKNALTTRELFEGAYARFVDQCRAMDGPGLGLIVIDSRTGNLQGVVCVQASRDRYTSTIIGRHGQCDLFVENDEELALRHVAVIIDPVREPTDSTRYRFLDLRTEAGMLDEKARALRSFCSSTPTIMRCSGQVVYAVPVGVTTKWPDSSSAAWAALPPSVYAEVQTASPMPDTASPGAERFPFTLRSLAGRDVPVGKDIDDGVLVVRGANGPVELPISGPALRDGVLLGRYERCDAACPDDEKEVSRVNVLLLRVEDRLLAIDTASTNGVRLANGEAARLIEVGDDVEITIGKQTRIRWIAAKRATARCA